MSEEEQDIIEVDELEDEVLVKTHEAINTEFCGEIQKLDIGYVELDLITTQEMVADSLGLIHGGFVFSAADYAAMLAVNERNVVLAGCDCQFLSPARFGDIIHVIAKVRHKEGRKRNVHVTAYVMDIKIFDAEFKTVVTDRHVLKLKLLDEVEK